MDHDILIEKLNDTELNIRLSALEELANNFKKGSSDSSYKDVNNHIHTWYSFSPYSPSKAVWAALSAGLDTAGIMDHDSVAGALEFIEAGRIAKLPVTVGAELRVDMKNTPVAGRRINNPDQDDVIYMAIHGIAHTRIKEVQDFFGPVQKHRNIRNQKMTENINNLTQKYVGRLDYEMDVIPVSKSHEGGSVTERHLLFALAGKIIATYGKGHKVTEFLSNTLNIKLSPKNMTYLNDENNIYYQYDLLGALKSDMVEKFYIPAKQECPDVKTVLNFVGKIGAISAYAYLGDVEDSVTGDKKAQKFEDDYILQLFSVLKDLGFDAVTYMPSRNTVSQLDRVKALCTQYEFMEISGEDINSPRQDFICKALRDKRYQNLVSSTYALINHEISATENITKALFSDKVKSDYPDLNERIKIYSEEFIKRRKNMKI